VLTIIALALISPLFDVATKETGRRQEKKKKKRRRRTTSDDDDRKYLYHPVKCWK
jgi:hypothetical protein